MSGKLYKPALLLLAFVLLVGVSLFQRGLNRQRADPELGLMRVTDLGTNAPPVLAFTTVALGGFRGLIANALWVRANDLQDEGKYFEMVQLADWITKLEPTFSQVWQVQAWNMAYNISVKFTDPADRWRWVQRGIELLRDDGLRYNPTEAQIYRELGWFFQNKMGQNLDDGHLYFKAAWAKEMTQVLGSGRPNFDELTNPKTDEAKKRAALLRDKYKMDPREMKAVEQVYGPMEWRLPESHAIYWASLGLKRSKKKELIVLRRVIYQSMHIAVMRGRLISLEPIVFGPDLSKVERANAAYERLIDEDAEMRHAIKIAHKNFLKEVVYLLYIHNRLAEAAQRFKELIEKYPDAIPSGQTLEEYALAKITGNVTDPTHDRTQAILEGILAKHYFYMALDDDEQSEAYERMARNVWMFYTDTIRKREKPLALPPLQEMKAEVVRQFLDPRSSLAPELKARLRNKLNLGPEAAAPATNTSPVKTETLKR